MIPSETRDWFFFLVFSAVSIIAEIALLDWLFYGAVTISGVNVFFILVASAFAANYIQEGGPY